MIDPIQMLMFGPNLGHLCHPQVKLREGYVFTVVCHSFRERGVDAPIASWKCSHGRVSPPPLNIRPGDLSTPLPTL